MKKLLLDEHLPHKLRHYLGANVFTVAYMRWDGVQNGCVRNKSVRDVIKGTSTV